MHAGVLGSGKKLVQFRRACEAKSHVEVGRRKCAWGHGATVRTRTASSPKQTSKTPGKPIKENVTVFVSSLEPQPAESTLVTHLCSLFIFPHLGSRSYASYSFCNSFFIKFRTHFFLPHCTETLFCPWGQRWRLLVWMVSSLAPAYLRTSTQNPGANRKMTPLIISMSNPVYSAEEANYVDRSLRAAPGWLQHTANTKLVHAWLNVGLVETSIIENFKFKNRRLWVWKMQNEWNKRSNIALLTCLDQFKCVHSLTFPHFYHLRYHRMK